MGDMGSLHFAEGANPAGIGAWKDKMPSAGEEVYDDMGGDGNGLASFPTNGTIGYNGNFGGLVDVSVSYNKNSSKVATVAATISGNSDTQTITTNTGSSSSVVVSGSPTDGATLFYGQGEKAGTTEETGTDMWTVGGTYAVNALTMGIQQTSIDKRLKMWNENTKPVAEKHKAFVINADRTANEIVADVEKAIN